MNLSLPLVGGCNCGAVRYRVSRAPLTTYICHCHLCQKRTGSPFSMSIVFAQGGLEITEGALERNERTTPDGRVSASFVCGACHSRTHTEQEGGPTFNLRAGTLDDTRWVRPVAQFWTSSAQPWAIVPGILGYEGQPKPGDYADMVDAWNRLVASPGPNT
jgi:hypothetical protein